MPIRFRCEHCGQLLGIARRKVGTEVACPRCHNDVMVPSEDRLERPRPSSGARMFESNEFDRWLGRSGQAAASPSREIDEPGAPVLDFDEVAEVVVKEPFAEGARPERRATAPEGAAALERIARVEPPRPAIWILAALAALGVVFGLGVLVGRHALPLTGAPAPGSRVAPASPSPPPVEAGVEPAPVAREPAPVTNADPPPALTITGTVRYRASEGELADEGAAILVIPADNASARAKLPVEGLRPEDRGRQSRAGVDRLRSAGGYFEYADPEGRFQIEVAQAGKYWVLILSRHKTREKEIGLLAGDRPILDQLFADAAKLVEGLEYLLVSRQVGPQTAQSINHSF